MSKQIISVVLYGLFGQGKSSIANMFIQGEIRQNDNMFEINDGVVGASATINFSKNDDFMVYDTIGVGETVYGKVPHKEAVRDKKLFYYLSETLTKNFGEYPIIPIDFPCSEEDDDNDAAVQRLLSSKMRLKKGSSQTQIPGFMEETLLAEIYIILKLFVSRNLYLEKTSIILFGLPGHGKSSIANMLIQGDIYHEGNAFEINDSMQSVSATIKSKTNKEFIVYDTIGISETYFGNVPHKEAIQMTRDYFSKCEDSLNYVIYVKKKSRFSEEDHNMFKLFKEIFMGNEKNFLIIITESDQDW
ncbi:8919_t:CDS:2, partial [Funneliformis geosporum]